MTDSTGTNQQEKPTKSRVKPVRERVVQKQLVSIRHGATSNELAEDQAKGSGTIEQQRAAVRPVSGDVVSRAPVSTESRFGHDFSRVPVNRSPQTRAFTSGQDIFFREGEYDPDSLEEQVLLTHELTHLVQQTGNVGQRQVEAEVGSRFVHDFSRVPAHTVHIQRWEGPVPGDLTPLERPHTTETTTGAYQQAQGSLWGSDDGPRPEHVRQGSWGDCWLLAALASIAQNHPEIIRANIRENPGNNTYTVRLYDYVSPGGEGGPEGLGQTRLFTMPADFAVGSAATEHGALWVALYERAAAHLRRNSYRNLGYRQSVTLEQGIFPQRSQHYIISGGLAREAFVMVAGDVSIARTELTPSMHEGERAMGIWGSINYSLRRNYPVTALSCREFSEGWMMQPSRGQRRRIRPSDHAPLHSGHWYTVTGTIGHPSSSCYIRMRDPYGVDRNDQPSEEAATHDVPLASVPIYFSKLIVARIPPDFQVQTT